MQGDFPLVGNHMCGVGGIGCQIGHIKLQFHNQWIHLHHQRVV